MDLLKKEYWWVWLILFFATDGIAAIILGFMLNVYDKNAWYAKWQYWLIGIIFIIPFAIMSTVFILTTIVKIAEKLDVDGKGLYLSPFVWVLFIIVPIFGWMAFAILYLYLFICIIIKLVGGEGEKYIK